VMLDLKHSNMDVGYLWQAFIFEMLYKSVIHSFFEFSAEGKKLFLQFSRQIW
jgi:hypothetical protein